MPLVQLTVDDGSPFAVNSAAVLDVRTEDGGTIIVFQGGAVETAIERADHVDELLDAAEAADSEAGAPGAPVALIGADGDPFVLDPATLAYVQASDEGTLIVATNGASRTAREPYEAVMVLLGSPLAIEVDESRLYDGSATRQ